MNSYTDIDGVPVRGRPGAADRAAARHVGLRRHRRRRLLRRRLPADAARRRRRPGRGRGAGADRRHRRRAADRARASATPLRRGGRATGRVDEALVDRAAAPGAAAEVRARPARRGLVARARRARGRDLERRRRPARHGRPRPAGEPRAGPRDRRAVGRAAAQRRRRCRSRAPRRIAVVGPQRRRRRSRVLGCYSFPSHVGVQHPEHAARHRAARPLLEALARRVPGRRRSSYAQGTRDRRRRDRRASPRPSRAARDADVVRRRARRPGRAVRPRHLRRGLRRRVDLRAARRAAATCSTRCSTPARRSCSCCSPAGRTRSAAPSSDAAAIVQTFFPGEEGAGAIAGVLSGRVNPRGRLPVSVPARPARQPSTYLAAPLGAAERGLATSTRRRPSPFGHGHRLHRRSPGRDLVDASRGGRRPDGRRRGDLGFTRPQHRRPRRRRGRAALPARPGRLGRRGRSQRLIGFARVALEAGAVGDGGVRRAGRLTSFTGRDGSPRRRAGRRSSCASARRAPTSASPRRWS